MTGTICDNNERRKKEICFIMPSLVGGGAERVASILTTQFANMGTKTTLFLVKQDVVEYKVDSCVKIDTSLCGEKKNPIAQIYEIRKLMRSNPNATFVSFLTYQNIYTVLAGIGLRNNTIVSLRNDPKHLKGKQRLLQATIRMIFYLADGVVFQTKDAQEYYPEAIQKKSKVILNPLQDNLPDYNVQTTEKKLITFCRLQPQKNLKMAIKAFHTFHNEYPEYTYHIFGKGDEKENLLKLIEDLGLQESVFIEDFKKNILEEAITYRAFLLTSDYEGLSNSMIEAVAMGMPAICTDCPIGGAKMIIENEKNGFLVPVGDENALVQAMKKITDIDTCIAVSNEAKKLAEQLKANAIAKQWCDILFLE